MKVLITYSCQGRLGYCIDDSAVDFINRTNEYSEGPYFIMNVLEITDEIALIWTGLLKWM